MPTQSLQGGIHGGFPSSPPPRRSGLDDVALPLEYAEKTRRIPGAIRAVKKYPRKERG